MYTWDAYITHPGIERVFEEGLDHVFSECKEHEFLPLIPDSKPSFTLSRLEIIEVYYMFEVWWNTGGWLRERHSNMRRGKMRGFVGESTDVQINRMLDMRYHKTIKRAIQTYLLDLTWKDFTYKQKLLYFYLIKKWRVTK